MNAIAVHLFILLCQLQSAYTSEINNEGIQIAETLSP